MSTRALVTFLLVLCAAPHGRSTAAGVLPVTVDSVGITVSDMDRAVAFYTSVLAFETVSDVQVDGREYEC